MSLPNGSEADDPQAQIMKRLKAIHNTDSYSFREKNRALGTARKFVACCVHWGDARNEYSEFIILLLPEAV